MHRRLSTFLFWFSASGTRLSSCLCHRFSRIAKGDFPCLSTSFAEMKIESECSSAHESAPRGLGSFKVDHESKTKSHDTSWTLRRFFIHVVYTFIVHFSRQTQGYARVQLCRVSVQDIATYSAASRTSVVPSFYLPLFFFASYINGFIYDMCRCTTARRGPLP